MVVDVIRAHVLIPDMDAVAFQPLRFRCGFYLVAHVVVGRDGDVAYHRAVFAHDNERIGVRVHERPVRRDAVTVAVKARAHDHFVGVIAVRVGIGVVSFEERGAVLRAVGYVGAEHYISIERLFAVYYLMAVAGRIILSGESLRGARRRGELVDVVDFHRRDDGDGERLGQHRGIARIEGGHRDGDLGRLRDILGDETQHVAVERDDVGMIGGEGERLIEDRLVLFVGGRHGESDSHFEHVGDEVIRAALVDAGLVDVRIESVSGKEGLARKSAFQGAVVEREPEQGYLLHDAQGQALLFFAVSCTNNGFTLRNSGHNAVFVHCRNGFVVRRPRDVNAVARRADVRFGLRFQHEGYLPYAEGVAALRMIVIISVGDHEFVRAAHHEGHVAEGRGHLCGAGSFVYDEHAFRYAAALCRGGVVHTDGSEIDSPLRGVDGVAVQTGACGDGDDRVTFHPLARVIAHDLHFEGCGPDAHCRNDAVRVHGDDGGVLPVGGLAAAVQRADRPFALGDGAVGRGVHGGETRLLARFELRLPFQTDALHVCIRDFHDGVVGEAFRLDGHPEIAISGYLDKPFRAYRNGLVIDVHQFCADDGGIGGFHLPSYTPFHGLVGGAFGQHDYRQVIVQVDHSLAVLAYGDVGVIDACDVFLDLHALHAYDRGDGNE